MEAHELHEQAEEAHHKGAKHVGLTMAITAVLLASATLLSHRAHTEEVVLQGERNTQWVNFDTKRMQRTMHEDFAILSALLPEGSEKAAEFREKAKIEREGEPAKNGAPAKEGSDKVREKALELDAEMKLTQRRADRYDAAELFLELSIVLCSVALLSEGSLYWRLSFITSAVGIGVAVWGLLLH